MILKFALYLIKFAQMDFKTGIGSSLKKIAFRIAGVVLMAYMLSFASCDTVPICWYCENPHNPIEWQNVCNTMTKNKLESYGYVCTPY